MKILVGGDLHITDKRPINRTDQDYLETVFEKLDFIFETSKDKKCDVIVFPGDIFDSHRANDFLKSALINLILEYEHEDIYCVYGQHDLRYHSSDKSNTPLNVLHSAEVIDILNDTPITFNEISFYGASFGEDIPEIKDKEAFNILVTHRMIITEKLWAGQEDFTRSNILLRNTDYDLIISGDNHTFFTAKYKDKNLINCGSMMRTTIAQEDHYPHICIFDTKTREVEKIPIPISDFHDIMDKEKARAVDERNEELEAFIETLKEDSGLNDPNISLDFVRNISEYVKKNEKELGQGVIDIINMVMED